MTKTIGTYFKDSEGFLFVITEIHSGFVWFRNKKGDLKQIDAKSLKYFKEVKMTKDEFINKRYEELKEEFLEVKSFDIFIEDAFQEYLNDKEAE